MISIVRTARKDARGVPSRRAARGRFAGTLKPLPRQGRSTFNGVFELKGHLTQFSS